VRRASKSKSKSSRARAWTHTDLGPRPGQESNQVSSLGETAPYPVGHSAVVRTGELRYYIVQRLSLNQ
jgi:hypothetical protein